MSNPSFENIDQWLFEYMEGNLSPSQITQLERFLLNNPEFDADMDAWQLAKADATPVVFPGVVGRKRKPVPFWLVPTITLLVTFVAGGFFGAYLISPEKFESADVESVAQALPFGNKGELVLSIFKSDNQSVLVSSNNSDDFGTSSFHSKSNQPDGVQSQKLANAQAKKLNPNNNSTKYTEIERADVSNASLNNGLTSTFVKSYPNLDDRLEKRLKEPNLYNVPNVNSSVIERHNPVEGIENTAVKNESMSEMDIHIEQSSTSPSEPKKEDNPSKGTKVDPETTAAAMTRGSNRISVNYEKSFASSLKSTWRKVVRMTDNPIALTNSKDIYYHAPGMQTLNVNFATAGNLLRSRIQTVSRAQWTGHSTQQLMNELSFDTYVRSIRGGIGVQLNHAYYNQGTYNIGQVALIYSPKFTVKRNFSIEPAIRFKMGDKRLNAQNLVPGQLIEMDRGNEYIFYNETPENTVKDLWYKDIGLGVSSNTKWFSIGFQADNLGRHYNNAFNSTGKNDRAGIHYTTTIGTDFISRSKIFSLSPYVMYQKVENLSEIWGGSIFRYKILTLGGGISSAGDYAGSIGLKTDRFMLTYNVDQTRSYLMNKRLFSQQLTMRILMKNGYK
jgi:Type IX secretion system membrane protein PorP/SprF